MNVNPIAWAASTLRLFTRIDNDGVNAAVPVTEIRELPIGVPNMDIALLAKGTGATLAQVPDGTAVGGNKRGTYATDWQKSRTAASQVASASFSTIGGGSNNTAQGQFSVVAGGTQNVAGDFYCFMGGGQNNNSNNSYSVVCGGQNHNAGGSGSWSFVGSGLSNTASSNYSFVGGGQSNAAQTSTHATVCGGSTNTASAQYAFVGAGSNNTASALRSVIGGGDTNTASITNSFVGGGQSNIASTGTHATVCGGNSNTASGQYSVVGGGNQCTATAQGAFTGGGDTNLSSATFSCIAGGSGNNADGQYSAILGGRRGTARTIAGYHVFPACNAPISTTPTGCTQSALLLLARQTTDATATVLRSNGSAAGTTNQVTLPDNSAYSFTGEVIAGVTGAGNSARWTIDGAIKRGANAASTAMIGTPTVVMTHFDAGAATWVVAVTADTTLGCITVTVTGAAATTIRWVCRINTVEMTY